LVITGILLALQVNNWNENQKDLSEEVNFLKGLKSDMESNVKTFMIALIPIHWLFQEELI